VWGRVGRVGARGCAWVHVGRVGACGGAWGAWVLVGARVCARVDEVYRAACLN